MLPKRPHFIVDNKVVTAAGCLIYKRTPEIHVLLIRYANPRWPLLDDFGGKVDVDDTSVDETIVRELSEETNNIITKIPGNYVDFYNPTSKYLCRVVEVSSDFYEDTSVFGDRETKDNIPRTVAWYKWPAAGLAQRLSMVVL